MLTHGSARLRDVAYIAAHQYYSVAVFFFVLFLLILGKIISLPLDFYGFRLEHRYHLSNQKLGAWLWDELKGWLVGLVLITILVEVLYATIRAFPEHWWLIAWAVFIGFTILLAQLAPVVLFPIFYHFEPLKNEALRERLVRLGERAGTRVRGVYEWKISEKSKKANAALTGLGKTRRIIIADTLLNNYTDDEIEAVLAHELGHHVHKHIPKGILLQVGITFFGFWAANHILRYAVDQRQMFQSLSDFANLPLLALVASVLGLLLAPVLNAYSRYNERQADEYAWKSIPAVEPFVSSMHKLASQNLAEENPARWIEVLFHSHPSIGKRTAAAAAWRTKQQPVA
jgi:STE24 endopeptidase